MDKLGSISPLQEAQKYYTRMLNIRKSLVDQEKSPENMDGFAYAAYKLALVDRSNPDKELLSRLHGSAEYREWYQIASAALREIE